MDTPIFEKEIEGLGKLQVFVRGACAWIVVPEPGLIGWAAARRKDGKVEYVAVNNVPCDCF